MRAGRWLLLLSAGLLFIHADPASAVIEAELPVKSLLRDSDAIYMTRVERLDAEKQQAVFAVQEEIQGKPVVRKLMVNLKTGKEADIPLLLKRLAPDLPVVMFETQHKDKRQVIAFTNGTWFQLTTTGENPWGFVGNEPLLRRTFKGTTAELKSLLEGVKSGKQKSPPVNSKEPPGLGPEVASKTKGQ